MSWSINAQSNKLLEVKDSVTVKQKVETDWGEKKVKYYTFGINPQVLKPQVHQALKERYNITFTSMGCVIDRTMVLYNAFVNEKCQTEYGLTVKELVDKLNQELTVKNDKK